MMAYLNGVAIPDLLSLRTLTAKYASFKYLLHVQQTFTCLHCPVTEQYLTEDPCMALHTHTQVCRPGWMTQNYQRVH